MTKNEFLKKAEKSNVQINKANGQTFIGRLNNAGNGMWEVKDNNEIVYFYEDDNFDYKLSEITFQNTETTP